MDDDDTDFMPSPSRNTSSNLASLFGFAKKPLQGNSSLTYTAPKAPKRESSPAKKQSEEKAKGKIIFSKAVQAYKLENRNYVNQGLIGIVISGNHESQVYEIILYKRTKEHLCQIRILGSFSITLSENNYVTFYDNNKQNWSIMFQSALDVEQFSQKVAICKFYSNPSADIVIQDLGPSSHQQVHPNSTIEVTYSSYALKPEELSKIKEVKEKINLPDYSFAYLRKGLIGCSENCKRVVIIPHTLSGPWLSDLGSNKDLLIEVKIEKIVGEMENLAVESSVDSSAEETAVKAKGASLKEALASTKSHKANLISRMARMGQATLPVKPELSAGASDSEEENTVTIYPKPRLPRSRNTAGINSTQNISVSQNSLPQNSEAQQQLTVYQNDMSMHQKVGVPYQQLIPVSASPISSPTTDPNVSVFISESRIQAAELRMGISKVSEKVDLVWNKIQNLSGVGIENKPHQQSLMDSGGILASIQNLIADNESLREKVEEQKAKIEHQSDRIFHLLELNHKYLEQNSTSHEKQSANESKLKSEMECLQKKEIEMEAANQVASEKLKNLESELMKSEERNKELKKRVEELTISAEELKRNIEDDNDQKPKELEVLKEKITRASETVVKLKERLKEVVSENENLKSVIQTQRTEIETGSIEMRDSKTKNEVYEMTVENLKRQISEEETKTELKIEALSALVAKLEEEKKSLIEKIKGDGDKKELKEVLPKILSLLRAQFLDSGKQHSILQVLSGIEEIFNEVISGTFNVEEKLENLKSGSATEEAAVTPPPSTSLQNPAPLSKEIEIPKVETKENKHPKDSANENRKKVDPNSQKKEEETDSRFKSYDQGWGNTRPPPPPLFDDDDDDDDWLD